MKGENTQEQPITTETRETRCPPALEFVDYPHPLNDEEIVAYFLSQAKYAKEKKDYMRKLFDIAFCSFFTQEETNRLREAAKSEDTKFVEEMIVEKLRQEREFARKQTDELKEFFTVAYSKLVSGLGIRERPIKFAVWPEIELHAVKMTTGHYQGGHIGRYDSRLGLAYVLTNTIRDICEPENPLVICGDITPADYKRTAVHEVIHGLSHRGENVGLVRDEPSQEHKGQIFWPLNEAVTEQLTEEFFGAHYPGEVHIYNKEYVRDRVLVQAVGDVIGQERLRELFFTENGDLLLLEELRKNYRGSAPITSEAISLAMRSGGRLSVEELAKVLRGD